MSRKSLRVDKGASLFLTSGRAHAKLANAVAAELGIELLDCVLSDFANDELYVRFHESVRNADVFLMQTHTKPINKWIMEELIMIDALKRASAHSITVISPFLGYARQDKKHLSRESITARLICDLVRTAGASRLMTVDLHSPQIQGFLDVPVDHLEAHGLLIKYIRSNYDMSEIAIVSPDAGRIKTATSWADRISSLEKRPIGNKVPLAFVHKYRDPNKHNEAKSGMVIGDIKGKDCFVVDDMIDTAGTLCGAADVLIKNGAKSVVAVATHGIFSSPAVKRLREAPFKEVVVTDTLPIGEDKRFDGLTVLSSAPLIARAINAVFRSESLGETLSRGDLPILKV